MMAAIKINKRDNFIYRGSTVRCLRKAFVGNPLKTAFFVTVNIAAKGAVTYTKYQGCFFLGQTVLIARLS